MKKTILIILLFLPVMAFAEDMVKVKVQKSTLFEEPKFFSGVVASVKYGDNLELLDKQKGWCYVDFEEQKGWIHESGLTSSKVSLGAIFVGGSSSSATHDEVALAGKGFTPEVERGYQESNPEMNFALVDLIERYKVHDYSLQKFIKEGGLKTGEVE